MAQAEGSDSAFAEGEASEQVEGNGRDAPAAGEARQERQTDECAAQFDQ